ncbi:MAG: prolipoprotein diacylglyceryl transferase [Bacteroidales bacterium]|nr:prolipoprotein diacylglyceryl transferase [Bacteroidales bacterium]MBN2699058.1 prolipoprotein diacylglyceryl transferase [Bacteroidales bacterium]
MFNYITWNVDPEIFHLGTLSIRWYGLMFAMAFLSGYIVFTRYLRTDHLTNEMLDELLIYIAVGTIIGARLGHCFFYEPEYFLRNPIEILKIWKGGLASHGAAITILLALWLYVRKYKLSFLWLIDRIVIVVALGGAFIRTGNLFNSEIYGLPTDLPWGFMFIRDKLYDSATGELLPVVPRHPTQIYEALSYLLIFAALFIFYRKRSMQVRDGYIFGVFMIALFTARFLIEFVKNDQVAFEAGMSFNMGQLLSIPFILAGVFFVVWTKKRPRYFSQTPVPKRPAKKKTGKKQNV